MRLSIFRLFAFVAVLSAAGSALAAGSPVRDDGIHTQPWIKSLTFLELKTDLNEAIEKGKAGLVILFEQPGCGACERLHEVNFAETELVSLITTNFDVIQINMYGDQEVTDFDGEATSEKKLAEKLLVNFTPTTIFIGKDATEVFRIPGYLKPNFYRSAFEYVLDEGPQKGILFPRWTKQRREAAAAGN